MVANRMKMALLAGCVGLLSTSVPAMAETLRYAHGNPPAAPSVQAAEKYAEAVEKWSDGSLKVRVYPNSLLSSQEISSGLRDGLTDIGLVLTAYFPAEYANFSMIADLSMLATSNEKGPKTGTFAFVGALMEYAFFNCPQCLDEFDAQNQVYMGGFASSPYALACTKPVTTLDDLRGASIRAVGSSWARWTEFVGANAITLPGSEMLPALSQGVVDCVEQCAADIINWGLYDVSTDVTLDAPGGVFAQVAGMQVNKDVWQRLGEQERTALLRGATAQAAYALDIYFQQDEEAIERLKEEGKVQLHTAAPDLVAKTREFIEQDRQTIVDYYEDNFGVENGAAEVEKFVEIFERWIGLVDGVETGAELEQVYWDELFSKLDPKAYGV